MIIRIIIISSLLNLTVANSPEVFITISSLATVQHENDNLERQIQLNWYNADPTDDDWIGLFNQKPTTAIPHPLAKHPIKTPQGTHTTTHCLDYPKFNKLQRRCIGFWVAYVRSNQTLATNCLKIEPNWMWENRKFIGHLTFEDILIPGTHDSGSFRPYKGWWSENIVTEYVFTQDEDFWNQLVYGIRSFDVRVAYYEDNDGEDKFYLNHNELRANPLILQLKSVRKFVEMTNEFVILDFHSFETGFEHLENNAIIHRLLLEVLQTYLGSVVIPQNFKGDATLNNFWKTKYRVLICYNDDFNEESDLLWPGIYQAWANTVKIEKLKAYFDNFVNSPRLPIYPIWSAQAEFTTDAIHFVTNPISGLREMADEVNINVTFWLLNEWLNKSNIVATDYFHGNNVIEVCIIGNKLRKDFKPTIGRM